VIIIIIIIIMINNNNNKEEEGNLEVLEEGEQERAAVAELGRLPDVGQVPMLEQSVAAEVVPDRDDRTHHLQMVATGVGGGGGVVYARTHTVSAWRPPTTLPTLRRVRACVPW
jgi:hypothetical protein